LCRICCTKNIDTKDEKMRFSCGHRFCLDCVTKYLKMKIKNGDVLKISCLEAGCSKKFSDDEVRHFVKDEGNWNKFVKFKINKQKTIIGGHNYVNCPIPDCEEVMMIDPAVMMDFCMECDEGHQFCARCKNEGWHPPEDCKRYDENLLEEIKNKNKKVENTYKTCPKCGVIIEKSDGCNHMKCINCNYEFCWICLERYEEEHYALYNLFGCPGMMFANPQRESQWYDNTCLTILWYILVFFLAIFAFFLIVVFFAMFGCSYELIKCYLTRNENKDDEEESDAENTNRFTSQFAKNEEEGNINNDVNNVPGNEAEQPATALDYFICVLLSFLGLLLQPFYLIFYILYGMMECYRRASCFVYYYSF